MVENEPRNKIWVGRSPKVQIREYEPCELSAGIQVGFDSIVDAGTLKAWYEDNKHIIDEILNDQERKEYERREITPPERLRQKPASLPPPEQNPQQQSRMENGEWDECPKCHGRKMKQYATCARCKKW